MSQDNVEKFIGRIITDDQFRTAIDKDFHVVCRENGFVFSEEELEIVRGMELDQFEYIARRIDRGIKRCS